MSKKEVKEIVDMILDPEYLAESLSQFEDDRKIAELEELGYVIREGECAVLNLKRRGCPNLCDIGKYFLKKYPELKEYEETAWRWLENNFDEIWNLEIEHYCGLYDFFYSETLGPLHVVGRSGGWWGFQLKNIKIEVDLNYLYSQQERLQSLILERYKDLLDLPDLEEAAELFVDRLITDYERSQEVYELLSEAIVLNQEQKRDLLSFKERIYKDADLLETPEYWENVIIDLFRYHVDTLQADLRWREKVLGIIKRKDELLSENLP